MSRSLVQRLLDRRFPQLMGLYLGISWGLIEVADWTVARYLLSKHWVDLVLIIAVTLIPTAVLLAWNHGKAGRDRVPLIEKIGIPINLMLTATLLVSQLQGKPLGRAAERVQIVNEQGQTVERLIPKQGLRTRAALFFWRNDSGDESLDWLCYGFPKMLERDLEQDLFFSGTTPTNTALLTRLRRAGFANALEVPVALQSELAKDHRRAFFVDGAFDRQGDVYQLRATIYSTQPARQVAEHRLEGADLLNLVDQLAVKIKPDLRVQKSGNRLSNDLPVSQHMTADVEAARHFFAGLVAEDLEGNYQAAAGFYRQATEVDPTFASAQLMLASTSLQIGDTAAATTAIQQALQHDYRLPERDRFRARGLSYSLKQEAEKIGPLFEQWTELYPTDIAAHGKLANHYVRASRLDEALTVYLRILEIDPAADQVRPEIARLLSVRGDHGGALAQLEQHAADHPDDPETQLHIGQLHWISGELPEARAAFEKASLLSEDGNLLALTAIGSVDLAEGKVDAARRRLQALAGSARDPKAVGHLLNFRLTIDMMTGQYSQAVNDLDDFFEGGKHGLPPVMTLLLPSALSDLYVYAGQTERALANVRKVESLPPPLGAEAHTGYLKLYMASGEPDLLEPHLQPVTEHLKKYQADVNLYFVEQARGRMLELRQDYAGATAAFSKAIEVHSTSILKGMDSLIPVRLYTSLGHNQRLAGDRTASRGSLSEALHRFPYHPEANLEMAKLLRDEGDHQQARQHLDRALLMWQNADPNYPPASEARALADELL